MFPKPDDLAALGKFKKLGTSGTYAGPHPRHPAEIMSDFDVAVCVSCAGECPHHTLPSRSQAGRGRLNSADLRQLGALAVLPPCRAQGGRRLARVCRAAGVPLARPRTAGTVGSWRGRPAQFTVVRPPPRDALPHGVSRPRRVSGHGAGNVSLGP